MNTPYSNSTNEIIKCVFNKSLTPYRRDYGRNRYHVARKFWALIIRFILTNKQNPSVFNPGILSATRNHAVLFYDDLRFEYDCYEFLKGKDRDWINNFRDTKEYQEVVNTTTTLYQSLIETLFNLIEKLKDSFSYDNINFLSISMKERPQPYLLSPEQILQVLASTLLFELTDGGILWPFRSLKPTELKELEQIMDSIFFHTILERIATQLVEFDRSYAVTFLPFKAVEDEMEAIQSFIGDSTYNYDLTQTKYVIETTFRKHRGELLHSNNLGRYLRRSSDGQN